MFVLFAPTGLFVSVHKPSLIFYIKIPFFPHFENLILTFSERFQIKNWERYDTSPPLHIGATRIVGYPSGSPSGEFLIASFGITFFSLRTWLFSWGLKKKKKKKKSEMGCVEGLDVEVKMTSALPILHMYVCMYICVSCLDPAYRTRIGHVYVLYTTRKQHRTVHSHHPNMQWRTRIIALSILDLKTLREGKEAVLKKLKNLRPVLRIPHSSNSIAVECSFISFRPTSILLCYRVKSTWLASADGSMFNMVLLHDSLMTFILFCFCRHEKLMRRWPM